MNKCKAKIKTLDDNKAIRLLQKQLNFKIGMFIAGYYAYKDTSKKHTIDMGMLAFEVEENSICEFVMKDKNGKDIYTNDKFTFEVGCNDNVESLTGSFEWNDEELRYEINIYDNAHYICLWYDSLKMRFFEIIPNET